MKLPPDYAERVYAGVLGKIIGVYLGRPFEQWSHERIERELGEIRHYVHHRRGVPLIVTDDDITGTFTFLRALPDHGCRPDLTPAEIGRTWLNFIIERRTILWWGGIGQSTEHTAWHRLRSGIEAPESGSIARNGRPVAEEIGAQIFIDGWGLVCPGDPARAADFAARAASVSHDGVAIHGAQVVAAMVALAFVEQDLDTVVDGALRFIPPRGELARMIADVRRWTARDGDWRETLRRIQRRYGYEVYGTNCPMISNHALIHLALAAGGGDFGESMMIVNTAGYDTDCNSGNVGCLLGVRGGLAAFEGGPDWRGPVADRLYLPTADGGRTITDALRESVEIVNLGRRLQGLDAWRPKDGARFHFALPGSVQGFAPDATSAAEGTAAVSHQGGALAIRCWHLVGARVARVVTPTFTPPEALQLKGYELVACPTLSSGQVLQAAVQAPADNAGPLLVRLCVQVYDAEARLTLLRGPAVRLAPGQNRALRWRVPATGGPPIASVGLEIASAGRPAHGTVLLDRLHWSGAPRLDLSPPPAGTVWQQTWVGSAEIGRSNEAFWVRADRDPGVVLHGTREWTDYRVRARLHVRLAASAGVVLRGQGLTRYYALVFEEDGRVRLVKQHEEQRRVLAERRWPRLLNERVNVEVAVRGATLRAVINGRTVLTATDDDASRPLDGGAAGLALTEGTMRVERFAVRP